MNIGDLFTQYGSDKDTEHSYGPIYQKLLGARRGQIEAVLEVGIAHGASLRAWRDWLPNAVVVGLDDWATLVFEDRIQSVRADSTNPEQVGAGLADLTFDLIVDDGSHHEDWQTKTFENLWKRVRPEGYYVIEDIQDESTAHKFAALGGEVVDRRAVKNRPDDLMAIFHKPKE